MSNRFKVFIDRPDIDKAILALLQSRYDLDIWEKEEIIPRDAFLQRIAGKDALFISHSSKIDAEALDAAGKNVKVIATMSTGYDQIHVEEVKKRGIKLGHSPGVLNDSVAELTVALLLTRTRRLFEGNQELREGKWKPWSNWRWLNGMGLKDSTIGIIGMGRIGIEVARRLVPFKIKKILYTSRTAKKEADEFSAVKVSLEELLKESDIVIVTCVFCEETNHLISDKEFSIMKNTAVIVNVSRGGVIDQDALVRALKKKEIAGAALDVMTPEPIPPDHELLSIPECCLIPHMGSAVTETRLAMSELTAKNIIAGLEGEELPAPIR